MDAAPRSRRAESDPEQLGQYHYPSIIQARDGTPARDVQLFHPASARRERRRRAPDSEVDQARAFQRGVGPSRRARKSNPLSGPWAAKQIHELRRASSRSAHAAAVSRGDGGPCRPRRTICCKFSSKTRREPCRRQSCTIGCGRRRSSRRPTSHRSSRNCGAPSATSRARPKIIRTVSRFGYAFSGQITGEVEAAPARRTCWIVWRGHEIPMQEGENIVGRDPPPPPCFDFPSVSRQHAGSPSRPTA